MTGKDRLRGGELNAALTDELVGIHAEYLGRGPTTASTFYHGNTIVTTMHDALTKAEKILAKKGRGDDVTEVRGLLAPANGGRLPRRRRTPHRPQGPRTAERPSPRTRRRGRDLRPRRRAMSSSRRRPASMLGCPCVGVLSRGWRLRALLTDGCARGNRTPRRLVAKEPHASWSRMADRRLTHRRFARPVKASD